MFHSLKILLLSGGVFLAWLNNSTIFADSKKSPVLSSKKQQATKTFKTLTIPGTHNVFRLSEKLITGSQPEGEAAFKALAAIGIKTIITVDGARPDIASAKKYGMGYVQIPFGYEGLPRDKSTTLARALRELPGPIYLHCHHGKHRSPTAAACLMIANEGWSNEDGLAFLKRAGTGANYTGLWDEVRRYKAPTEEEMQKAPNDFPSVAPTTSLVQTMVRMDELVEHLLMTKKVAWKKPIEHPDLDPSHEALMLREVYTELQREEGSKKRPADYRKWLVEGKKRSQDLETALRAGEVAKADEAYGKITANCQACHAVYRNVPQKPLP